MNKIYYDWQCFCIIDKTEMMKYYEVIYHSRGNGEISLRLNCLFHFLFCLCLTKTQMKHP